MVIEELSGLIKQAIELYEHLLFQGIKSYSSGV